MHIPNNTKTLIASCNYICMLLWCSVTIGCTHIGALLKHHLQYVLATCVMLYIKICESYFKILALHVCNIW